ncbi:hypothetical protein GCM10007275_03270 [Jeotgalicoccus coquinae]|nr:hypothetical protein GCM10007275_03270 [Jeotgalicoccus coquinae]
MNILVYKSYHNYGIIAYECKLKKRISFNIKENAHAASKQRESAIWRQKII